METTLDPAELEPEDRKIIEEHLARLQTNVRATGTPVAGDGPNNKGKDRDEDSESEDREGDKL